MRAIVVEEERFDLEFEATLDKLRVALIDERLPLNLDEIYRKVHYETHLLKDRLKKAGV